MKTGTLILLSFVVGALLAVVPVGLAVGLAVGNDTATAVAPVGGSSSGAGERRLARVGPPREAGTAVVREPRAAVKELEGATAAGPALITIPRLGLEATVGTSLNAGPAWWPVTGRPGGGDTIAIAGHRTTYTQPFHDLDRLRPDDRIEVRWAGRVHAYRVTGTRILSARDLHIADARGYEILLLSACHPKGSARQRIVVYARPLA